ncbi:hypothetical protein [Saccharolobus sp. E5-1-F]|nr:hypothetical protein [Sulfolobus sp. E5-1-F]
MECCSKISSLVGKDVTTTIIIDVENTQRIINIAELFSSRNV